MKAIIFKQLLLLFSLATFVLLSSCDDDEPDPTDTAAATASSIVLDDITNLGNAQDFLVSFATPIDETSITEYRVMIVNNASSGLTLEVAENVGSESYLSISPSGQAFSQTLPTFIKDTEGNDIVEGSTYSAYVLSIADGTNANINALSRESNRIKLAQTTVKISYLQNDGVLIDDGISKVIIDAIFTPANGSGWIPMPSGELNKLLHAESPYDNVSIAMTTHNHGDHYGPTSISSFLSRSSTTRFIGPPQVIAGLSSQSQVESLSPAFRESVAATVNGIDLEVFNIKHFNPQDGTDFSSTENFAFLVTLGGLNILHIGDGELTAANFENAGLKDKVDIVLLPTFTFSGQLTTASRDVLFEHINPKHIIGLHLATTTPVSSVAAIYPDAVVFNDALQFYRF